jgi:hypothetical protein
MTPRRSRKLVGTLAALLLAGPVASCATHIRKPAMAPQPATARFGQFGAFELRTVALAPAFGGPGGANEKATRKIDELLQQRMPMALAGIRPMVPAAAPAPGAPPAVPSAAPAPAVPTLLINPQVEEIKFVGGGARFWGGAMAGSSAVLMKVSFIDAATGRVLAEPEFYESAGAYAGAWSFGGADNAMLSHVVDDVCSYSAGNR